MMISNAKDFPSIWYGIHFAPGVAQYNDSKGSEYKIFLNSNTLLKMDATFAGKPIYVQHVDKVELDKIHEADGYVVESFFNELDGFQWVKFIAVSDEAKDAIVNKKWKLSNAYIPSLMGNPGTWHGVPYDKEVLDAQYEHLAIVPNPRYAESIILSPEEYKQYCNNKKAELERVANSLETTDSGDKNMGIFNWFKTTKLGEAEVEKLLNAAEPKEEKKEEAPKEEKIESKEEAPKEEVKEKKEDAEEKKEEIMAEPHHLVNLGEEKKTVKELIDCNNAMKEEIAALKAKHYDDVKKDEIPVSEHEKAKEAAEIIEEHEKKSIEEETKKNNFDKIKNAEINALKIGPKVDLTMDQVIRGKQRYGSGK